MRIVMFAAAGACIFLAAAEVRKRARPTMRRPISAADFRRDANAAAPSNAMVMLAAAPSKDQALKIMHERHEAMEGLGKAMKALHRELDASQPDINVSPRPDFDDGGGPRQKSRAGSRPGPDPTSARPVRSRRSGSSRTLFARRSKDFAAAAQAIDAAAKAGDMNKVMALHENVDKACKACHDPFRAPEH